ncbi:MAG TPA: TetR/AcrR family transcriptional regulator [Streptosporangiaceae bacterium]|nr:TetR/AcrR family transcriptional regulator [Streptosporangiaceae bacterium]
MPDRAGAARRTSLRAEQVRQTRAALIAAGRLLFGRDGFAATSVEDLASQARVTTGALYHHFPNKLTLFETVFEAVHGELLDAAERAAASGSDELESIALSFQAYLDQLLEPEVQRILIVDAPAVLGLARFTELDERYAFAMIEEALRSATAAGQLAVRDPETVTRLLLGAIVRGGTLIASSAEPDRTRDAVAAALRTMLAGFAAS